MVKADTDVVWRFTVGHFPDHDDGVTFSSSEFSVLDSVIAFEQNELAT